MRNDFERFFMPHDSLHFSASIEIQNQIMLCLRLRLLNYVTYRNYDSELPRQNTAQFSNEE